jgi:hypothetical protein
MNYFGQNYTEDNDTSYPTLPKLIVENGVIQQLDFWVQPNQRINWRNLPGLKLECNSVGTLCFAHPVTTKMMSYREDASH